MDTDPMIKSDGTENMIKEVPAIDIMTGPH